MITDTNNIRTYCSLFIPFRADTILTKVYLDFIFAIKIAIIVKDDLDYYRYFDSSSHFCKFCCTMLLKKRYQNLDLLTALIFHLSKNI